MVERVGGVDGAESRDRACRSDHGGSEGGTSWLSGRVRHNFCRFLAAAQNLAGYDQREGEQEAKRHPRARTEPALFDRLAHEQKAAEGQRAAAEIERPAQSRRRGRPRQDCPHTARQCCGGRALEPGAHATRSLTGGRRIRVCATGQGFVRRAGESAAVTR